MGLNKRTWGLSRTYGMFRGRTKGGKKTKVDRGGTNVGKGGQNQLVLRKMISAACPIE